MTNPQATPPSAASGKPAWLTMKLVTVVVLIVIALVFVFTNQSVVQVQLLFWSVNSPLWVLILIVLVVGILIGSLVPWLRSRKGA